MEFIWKGLTNRPKATELDSDEDDETASKRYLEQVQNQDGHNENITQVNSTYKRCKPALNIMKISSNWLDMSVIRSQISQSH